FLQQEYRKSAQREIARNAGAGDPSADDADVVCARRAHQAIKCEPATGSAGCFVLLLKLVDDGFGKVCRHLIVV
ncbi:MAG: hypothetical protein QOI23_1170, partial [Chloroflexota bacterium]|nr:hypothetical protein [Chloroflexota bacterium]